MNPKPKKQVRRPKAFKTYWKSDIAFLGHNPVIEINECGLMPSEAIKFSKWLLKAAEYLEQEKLK